MSIDKATLKAKLLSLEEEVIATAEQSYQEFFGQARVDRDQTVELDDMARSATQSTLADEVEHQLHEHREHLKQIRALSFEPLSTVQPGAVVKLAGKDRHLIVAVATSPFTCEGWNSWASPPTRRSTWKCRVSKPEMHSTCRDTNTKSNSWPDRAPRPARAHRLNHTSVAAETIVVTATRPPEAATAAPTRPICRR